MNWYQVKISIERIQEDGFRKKVSELYLVQAICFSEAEKIVQNEVAKSSIGEFDVVAISRKNYSEIIDSKLGSEVSDRWYKCKVNFIMLDEKSGKEKRKAMLFLVQSASALCAHKSVDDFMDGQAQEYEIGQVDETKILEVFKVAQA